MHVVASGGAQGGDRQGQGDSATGEASRNRRSPQQEGCIHGTVLTLFHHEGEQGIPFSDLIFVRVSLFFFPSYSYLSFDLHLTHPDGEISPPPQVHHCFRNQPHPVVLPQDHSLSPHFILFFYCFIFSHSITLQSPSKGSCSRQVYILYACASCVQ